MGGAKLLLALALLVTAFGLAACGDDDDDEGGTTTGAGGEPILITTHLEPLKNPEETTTGQVLPASTIGDSAFCRGGTFRDAPTQPPDEDIVRLFRCSSGTLTISFVPSGSGRKLTGDWEVVRGSGRLEGVSGGGQLKTVFVSTQGEGRETFTGKVTR